MAQAVNLVRPAKARDIDAIAHLWEELVAFHHALDAELPPSTSRGALHYGRRILDRIDDPSACVLVAEVRHEVVGYALGFVVDLMPEMFQQEPSGFLADIYVAADYRRQGVGRALVEQMVGWFRDNHLSYWEWHVAALNPEAVAFWRAMGGREVMLRMRAPIDSPVTRKG